MSGDIFTARLDVVDASGKLMASYPLTTMPVIIGRSMQSDVWIDDPYIAAQHCSMFLGANGLVQVTALPSANGVLQVSKAGSAALQSSELPDQAILIVGETRLRIRIQDQTQLAPELLLASRAKHTALGAVVKQAYNSPSWVKIISVLGLIYLIELIGFYTRQTGELKLGVILSSILGLAMFIGAWTAGWSILSRIFSGEAKFKGHLLIALTAVLISSLWNEFLDLLGFGFSLRQVDMLDTVSRVLVATIASYFHLKLISSERLVQKGLGLATTFIVSFGILGLVQFDQLKRTRQSAIYAATKPAAFELKAAKSLDDAVSQFNAQKIIIDSQRKEKPPEASDFSLFDDD